MDGKVSDGVRSRLRERLHVSPKPLAIGLGSKVWVPAVAHSSPTTELGLVGSHIQHAR